MSWILTRTWTGAHVPVPAYRFCFFQMYKDADKYGKGKWEGDEAPWWHLPEQYLHREDAQTHLNLEAEKDPEWDYKVEYYE